MRIARGWGILVPVLGVLCFTVTGLVVIFATGDSWEKHRWPKILASLVTAGVVWPVGRWLNRPKYSPDDVRNSEWDEQLAHIRRSWHTLMSIPFEWWAPIIAFFGILLSLVP
jgi:hypothetical protein